MEGVLQKMLGSRPCFENQQNKGIWLYDIIAAITIMRCLFLKPEVLIIHTKLTIIAPLLYPTTE